MYGEKYMQSSRITWLIVGGMFIVTIIIWLLATILQPYVWVNEFSIEDRYRRDELIFRDTSVTLHQIERSKSSFSRWHQLEIIAPTSNNCYQVGYTGTSEGRLFVLCHDEKQTLVFSNDEYRHASKFEALVITLKSLIPFNY